MCKKYFSWTVINYSDLNDWLLFSWSFDVWQLYCFLFQLWLNSPSSPCKCWSCYIILQLSQAWKRKAWSRIRSIEKIQYSEGYISSEAFGHEHTVLKAATVRGYRTILTAESQRSLTWDALMMNMQYMSNVNIRLEFWVSHSDNGLIWHDKRKPW